MHGRKTSVLKKKVYYPPPDEENCWNVKWGDILVSKRMEIRGGRESWKGKMEMKKQKEAPP